MSRNRKHGRKQRRRRRDVCVWCDRDLTKATRTLEHLIPKCHGGPDESWNLAWACFQCNGERGSDVATPAVRARLADVLATRIVPAAWEGTVNAIRDGCYDDRSFDPSVEART